MTALVLLDLSAAFDVIDHWILQKRLEYSFGMTGSILSWIQSHLSDTIHCFMIGRSTSEGKCLKCGVPQGSVLGPRKYCLYYKIIGAIWQRHNLRYHWYADHTHVCISIMSKEIRVDAWSKQEACFVDVCSWISANILYVEIRRKKMELIILKLNQVCCWNVCREHLIMHHD